jgi:HK97 family phage prohead protease
MDRKSFRLEVKALDETGTFEGRLAIYNNVDEGGDVIEPGAFRKTLQEGGGTIPLLWNHQTAEPIGTLELADSATALLAKGRLVLSVNRGREVYDLMRAGAVKGLSIGYRVVKEQLTHSVRRLKEIRLYEGSLCVVPMNPEAQVTSVKQQQTGPDIETLDAFRNAARDLKDFYRRTIDGD